MQYMLLIYGDETAWANMSETETKRTMQAYVEYSKALAASGILRGGSELASVTTATTVRVRSGRTLTTDGPFIETKEQLGGAMTTQLISLFAEEDKRENMARSVGKSHRARPRAAA